MSFQGGLHHIVSPLKSQARQEFALVKNRGTIALLADAQMSTVNGPISSLSTSNSAVLKIQALVDNFTLVIETCLNHSSPS